MVQTLFFLTGSLRDMARLDVTETVQGVFFPGHMHTQDSLQQAQSFHFQDSDTIIVSYPKSGKKSKAHPSFKTKQPTTQWCC